MADRNVKAVIFDVDGTLVDTVDMHADAWQRALREFGKQVRFEDVRGQIGKGSDKLMPVFVGEAELEEIGEQLEGRRGDIYKSEHLPRVKAFPKVRELFERILNDGLRVALASSAPEDELTHYKEVADIADLIDAATSADDAEESKPEPDIFAAAVKSLKGVTAEECVVVGDTPYDVIAARKIGIRAIGVLSGGFPESSLRDEGAVEIYEDPADLLGKYERSLIGRAAVSKASGG
ncbi:MAG TPA: HAD family hydrolase [Chthoniobacteraceae bacterium]|nr:HAD family hydrolase [Chthoniobacteraceae bacterium]